MRVMMKVSMRAEAGNRAIVEGKLPRMFTELAERAKPEAAYFLAEHGRRTAVLFLDLAKAEDIPTLAEPFFRELGASVEITPAMNMVEMQAGVRKVREKQ